MLVSSPQGQNHKSNLLYQQLSWQKIPAAFKEVEEKPLPSPRSSQDNTRLCTLKPLEKSSCKVVEKCITHETVDLAWKAIHKYEKKKSGDFKDGDTVLLLDLPERRGATRFRFIKSNSHLEKNPKMVNILIRSLKLKTDWREVCEFSRKSDLFNCMTLNGALKFCKIWRLTAL